MKKIIFMSFLTLFISIGAHSQILDPVTWSYAAKKTTPTEATIYIKASIDKGWHLYSQFIKDGGPVKTSFNFPSSPTYVVLGKTMEPKPISKYESTFKMDVSYFENTVVFQQKVKLKAELATVKGSIEFMVCDDKQCLPPSQVNFSVPVK